MHRLAKLVLPLLIVITCLLRAFPALAQSVAANATDLGPPPGSTSIRRMQLVLARTPTQEQQLEALLAAQQQPGSPSFHRWLTPMQFGESFGPSSASLAQLTDWLQASGFSEIHVSVGRTVVEFSGPAQALRTAFGADLHAYVSPGGESFYRAVSIPIIPPDAQGFAALGVPPRQPAAGTELRRDNATGNVTLRPVVPGLHPNLTLNSNNTTYYAITPYDFAAIYDVLPLWSAATPIDGTGQTIAIAGDTDINPADFVAFRTLFGLPLGNTATPTGTQYLNLIYNGPRPAVRTDEFHAASDTQWAGAAARGATIDYVASESTEASSGLDLSAAYIVDNNLASILVYSYAQCELSLGTAGNAFYKALWQQAAAQGIAVVTATGDSGAAACDGAHIGPVAGGTAVNGIGATPYDVSVGATEFYTPNGTGSYFSATNGSNFGSANGYIPEQAWNDSCTNPLLLAAAPYVGLTAEQACNTPAALAANLVTTAGSGGGASTCTTSDGTHPASCTGGYPKPTWQARAGVPADNLRHMPDVALFGSQGRTNSFYVVCQQSRNTDGQACNLNAPYSDFSAYGGTELTAPAFAGVLALAGQKQAPTSSGRLGNPNIVLYALAAKQAAAGLACNATGTIAPGCYFHDITTGTNAMPCLTGSPNCTTTTAGDAYGILTGNAATAGYDQATGLGSIDAANLVNAWTTVGLNPSAAVLAISPVNIVHGAPVTATVTVTGNSPTGQVSLNSQAANGSVGAGPLANAALAQTFRTFPGGTYGIRAHYEGDPRNYPADSNFVSITVAPEPSTTTLRPLAFDPATGVATPTTSAPYGRIFYLRADVAGQSGQGVATGNIALADNAAILGAGVYRLNSSGYTEAQTTGLTPGTHTLAASYAGDASFNASAASATTVTITKAATTSTVTTSTTTVSQAGTLTLSATIATTGYGFAAPSGSLNFMAGTQVLGTSTLLAGSDPATYYRTATAILTISAGQLPAGPITLTAAFPGDPNYLASTAAPVTINVTASTLPASSTSLLITPGQVAPGGMVVLGATVAPTASGTVQFAIDGQNVASPVLLAGSQGAYGISIAPYTPGLHYATATYSGGSSYRSSVSPATPFFITATTALGIPIFTVTPAIAVQGTYLSVAARAAQSTATGRVQLLLDGAPYGSPVALASAAATLPLVTTTLQTGPRPHRLLRRRHP